MLLTGHGAEEEQRPRCSKVTVQGKFFFATSEALARPCVILDFNLHVHCSVAREKCERQTFVR